jgi:uncharacterized protein YegP (UPF0339 family)
MGRGQALKPQLSPVARRPFSYSIYRDGSGFHRWALYAPDGGLIATSAMGFVTSETALKALRVEAEQRGISNLSSFAEAA